MDVVLQAFSAQSLLFAAGLSTILAIVLGYLYTLRRKREPEKLTEPDNTTVSNDEGYVLKERGDAEGTEQITEEDKPVWPTGKSTNETAPVRQLNCDPIDYCSHIPREVRKTQQRLAMEDVQKTMDEEAKVKEREIQREQLQAIFKMMASQEERFGVKSMDDIQDQMRLYSM